MSVKTSGSDFTDNLGKIYGFYTGGFLAFVILLAILEWVGVSDRIIGYLFVFFTLAVYAIIGIVSRTMQVSEYYVAGRRVPAFYNGMATGADWMSAASFIGMAGTLYALGYDGLGYVLGWTGGYVLVAVLVAPYLRKFGAYTVPDFLAARYGGNFARLLGIVVLLSCSFTYVVAQIVGTGLIASRFLGMDFQVAVYVGLLGILVCSMLGGMRAVTWTQVAQYIVLIIAYLLPVVILSAQKFGWPIPQLTYGQVLQEITAREQQMVADGLAAAGALKQHTAPFVNLSPLNFFGLILCLMVGTASLPHVLMRYFTTPSVREARKSVAWSLLFIFILYFTAPAYAAFAKLEVFTTVIGAGLTDLAANDALSWVYKWGSIGLVKICGVDAGIGTGGHRCLRAGRQPSRRDHVCRLQARQRRDRHRDAGNRRTALCRLRTGRGRRPGGGAVDGRRPAAGHRQRAQPRRLLQDDRHQRADPPAADRRPGPAPRRRRRRRLHGVVPAGRHRRDGGLGLQPGCGRPVPCPRPRHLVEADHVGRGDRRHGGRLRHHAPLPGGDPLLPGVRRQRPGDDVAGQPGDRRAGGRRRGSPRRSGHGLHGARLEGRLVQRQQHLVGAVRPAARLRGDDRRRA